MEFVMVERYRPDRNIMRRFRLEEVSAVDRPAQEEAKATIIKRDDDGDRAFRKFPEALRAADRPITHDFLTETMLKLRLTPLTTAELDFAGSLEGEDRRAFLIADHPARLAKMTGKPEREDPPTPKPEPVPEEDDADMTTFKTFEDAMEHYVAGGMAKTAAMRTTRELHPDLYAKLQARPAEIAKAASAKQDVIRKNQDRQRRINALVHSTQVASRCGPVAAIQKVRQEHPELFVATA
jgi:hypothetical protein